MKNIDKTKKGFTLIEILVVIGILTIILAFGMSINFSAFTSSTFQGERSKIVSVLERARSHAMANMFESKYGVCYLASDYVIFHDGTCDKSATDETVPANTNIATASNFSATFPNVVFNRLTGNKTGGIINFTITDGVKSAPIEINDEGRINW